MTLKIDRDFDERMGVTLLTLDAMEYAERGWDASAWLQLCCVRIDRVRRGKTPPAAGLSPTGRLAAAAGTLHILTAEHCMELATLAAFAFPRYPHKSIAGD